MHNIRIDHLVLEPEEGLLLGNGDLSISIYQKSDQIIWRFGKNDVWDRRLDLSDSPKPANIDEIAHGIRDEGWVNYSYISGRGEATRGTDNPERMKELCDGYPAYAKRPYPCPKPVGELAMHLPVDQRDLRISQQVFIEWGKVELECRWDSGVVIYIQCFVPPSPNVLVVNWSVKNWTNETRTGYQVPVWFSLYRWPDPTLKAFASKVFARSRYQGGFAGSVMAGKAIPLPPPTVKNFDGLPLIEQRFYPDLRFQDGFRYVLAPFVTGLSLEPVPMYDCDEAHIHMCANEAVLEGSLAVAVPTSTDMDGVEGELRRVSRVLASGLVDMTRQWEEDTRVSAEAFWSRSAVEIDDPLLENVWYETLYVKRCAFRAGVIAPGLALPSTVQDYSLWHGDYHTNYNYQSGFWGDCTANHIELYDSFFPGMNYMVEIGRKLAREYWNCRGTFIQLTGYPFEVEDDPYGTGALSRMAYMTGWIANHYWWRYAYTQDLQWLRLEGYPVIRDCALFYTDFLKQSDDGKYHAFPSSQGEYFFTGSPQDYTDQPQVIRHARYCLQSAVQASEALNVDEELRLKWQEVLDNLVVVDDLEVLGYSQEEQRRYFLYPPEFISYDNGQIPKVTRRSSAEWRVGLGQFAWKLMINMRNGLFEPEHDIEDVKAHLRRWRLPNGTIRAMASGDHGFVGAYTESLGILCPLQEMMLQSWDGIIRVFPAWAKYINASFKTLRAEGAFLVSASWRNECVQSISIASECGKRCRIASPWDNGVSVIDEKGETIGTEIESGGIISFETTLGQTYQLQNRR